jgi:peptide/nickel transport system substrate-binding protein
MNRNTQIAIAALIIIVVVAGAAWYAMTPAPGAPTTTTTEASPTTTEVPPTTTAAPAAPTLLSATFANVPTLDPAIGSDEAASSAFVNLYDTLVYPESTGGVKPSVATDWSTSSDGLTWTFKLRTDVKFHDGTPLTADDVVFSLNRMLAMGQGYSYLFTPYVDKVSAPDPQTVVITLKKEVGPFVTFMVRIYILNKKLVTSNFQTPGPYGDNGDYGSKWLLTNDAGSGPYKVKEAKLEAYVLMERFKDYWGEFNKNAPDQFKMIGTSAAATVKTMISTGDIDITDRWQSTEALDAMSKLPGITIVSIPTSAEFYLMMNTKKPPTDDINFRAAVTYAFDYQTVTKNIFPGYHQAAGPVPSALPGHDPNAVMYQRDVAKAMEYLKKSKYYGQLDKYPIVYHWIAEVPDEEKVALLFADNMKDIGVSVQVVKVPWLSVVDEMGKLETSPNIVTIFVEASYAEAGSIMIQRYHSKSTGTWEQNEWLKNSTVDNMLDDAVATVDTTQRLDKYIKAQQVLMSMYLSIYVVDQSEIRAYYAGYVDWYAAKGQNNPILGYNWDVRLIGFDAAKKHELFPG